jgi:membrane-bound lytic murein transglycosylase D
VTGYRLRIPLGSKDNFLKNYAQVPADQKKAWVMHKVQKGQTLAKIATKYGVTASVLRDINNIKTNRPLKVGSSLAIPVSLEEIELAKVPFEYDKKVDKVTFGKGKQAALAAAKPEVVRSSRSTKTSLKAPKGKEQLAYTVKRGDTIGHIAEWYGVRASDLRNWNNIGYGSTIQAGEQCRLPRNGIFQEKKLEPPTRWLPRTPLRRTPKTAVDGFNIPCSPEMLWRKLRRSLASASAISGPGMD